MSIINGLWKTASIGGKLLGAAGALFIASVMLVMSTVAWFTISKTPQASEINVNVSNTQNFEIAKARDAGETKPKEVTSNDEADEYAWGANITFGSDANPVAVELPVKVTDGVGTIQTVKYDTGTGRTAGLVDVTAQTPMTDGVGYYTYTDEKGNEKKCAAVMGMWLRTNTSGTISAKLEDLKISKSDFNSDAIGIAIKLGADGTFKTLKSSDDYVEIGKMEANKNDPYYTQLIVYLNGDTDNGDNGVVAYDVGGTENIKIELASIKFKNSAITETN